MMGYSINVRHPFNDGKDATTKRVYIIVHEPGRIPDKKIPPQTNEGVSEFLLGLELCQPKGTRYTVVQLIWDGDIWVSDGHEWLTEHRLATPRKFATLKRKVKDNAQRLAAHN